jgi:hypothetical protein
MKFEFEVGKKYQRDGIIIDIKFIDHEGTGWGLDQDGAARFADIRSIDKWNEYTEPKPPQYIPYTWEDHIDLLGRWYKFNGGKNYAMVIKLEIERGVLIINGITAQSFLDNYVWYNDTPCGKEVK